MDAPALTVPDFDAVVADLRDLSRNHLLVFRVEVGRTIAEAFYGGDVASYRDRSAPGSLSDFLFARKDELGDLGLGPRLIRESLLAWQVFRELPEDLRPRLVYSHVVALARVEDRATRQLLAQATLENGWRGPQLEGAIAAAASGRWIDADPKPGLQPPEPPQPEPAKKPAVGWALKRVERSVAEFSAVADTFDEVAVDKLSTARRERALAAATALRDRADRLVQRLGSQG
jgi:hypothetical protein